MSRPVANMTSSIEDNELKFIMKYLQRTSLTAWQCSCHKNGSVTEFVISPQVGHAAWSAQNNTLQQWTHVPRSAGRKSNAMFLSPVQLNRFIYALLWLAIPPLFPNTFPFRVFFDWSACEIWTMSVFNGRISMLRKIRFRTRSLFNSLFTLMVFLICAYRSKKHIMTFEHIFGVHKRAPQNAQSCYFIVCTGVSK